MTTRDHVKEALPALECVNDPRGGGAAWALLVVGGMLIAGILLAMIWVAGAW
ncbi:MAG: hypothetical protein ACRDS9_23425 [Pseudonocardiaceae bacterium]